MFCGLRLCKGRASLYGGLNNRYIFRDYWRLRYSGMFIACRTKKICTTQSIYRMLTYYNTPPLDLSTAANFDLEKFQGVWYQIARYDNSAEHDMIKVSNEYTLQNDGTIVVTSQGWRDGSEHCLLGRGKVVNPQEPGYLKVAFMLNFYTPYRILLVDDDYSYALVASRGDKNLWILSRTTKMMPETLKYLLSEASGRGFDTSKLIYVKH